MEPAGNAAGYQTDERAKALYFPWQVTQREEKRAVQKSRRQEKDYLYAQQEMEKRRVSKDKLDYRIQQGNEKQETEHQHHRNALLILYVVRGRRRRLPRAGTAALPQKPTLPPAPGTEKRIMDIWITGYAAMDKPPSSYGQPGHSMLKTEIHGFQHTAHSLTTASRRLTHSSLGKPVTHISTMPAAGY